MDENDPRPEKATTPTPLDHTPSPSGPSTGKKLTAEALGTFLLVFGGVGAALFSTSFGATANGTPVGIGVLGVALAFGLTVAAGTYAWGPISGGHFNPAVTLGLAAAGRFPWNQTLGYIVAQVVGGVVASTVLVLIGVFGPDGWLVAAQDAGFASNGFGASSPGGFGLGAAIVAEVIVTALFLLVILGVTNSSFGTPLAGLVIGLTLALVHLVLIPIDNAALNPARSIAAALYGGIGPLAQLWVFVVFPILGAMIAGLAHRTLFDRRD